MTYPYPCLCLPVEHMSKRLGGTPQEAKKHSRESGPCEGLFQEDSVLIRAEEEMSVLIVLGGIRRWN